MAFLNDIHPAKILKDGEIFDDVIKNLNLILGDIKDTELFTDDKFIPVLGSTNRMKQLEIGTSTTNYTACRGNAENNSFKIEKQSKPGIPKAWFSVNIGVPLEGASSGLILKIKMTAKSGGQSGGGAYLTACVESLQCYYLSLAYNIVKGPLSEKHNNLEELEKGKEFCDTWEKKNVKMPLETAWKTGPEDWISTNVYITIANKIYESIQGSKFNGIVNFHRGSPFMDAVYGRKKLCHIHDKDEAKEKNIKIKAPASFSNDKWNPGDIWMTVRNDLTPFPEEGTIWEGRLGKGTCDWMSLKDAVRESASSGITLGISLKKVKGSATITEFNTKKREQNRKVTYKGYRFGKNNDFFSSTDLYLIFDNGAEIQYRSTATTSSWQGEIKGSNANGGKIGGGGTNYYCEKHLGRTIGGGAHSGEMSHNWKETKVVNITNFYSLYNTYVKDKSNNPAFKNKDKFEDKCDEYINSKKQKAGPAFKFSKNMCLQLVEALEKNKNIDARRRFGRDIFRYAMSNSDYSSYFIKVS